MYGNSELLRRRFTPVREYLRSRYSQAADKTDFELLAPTWLVAPVLLSVPTVVLDFWMLNFFNVISHIYISGGDADFLE